MLSPNYLSFIFDFGTSSNFVEWFFYEFCPCVFYVGHYVFLGFCCVSFPESAYPAVPLVPFWMWLSWLMDLWSPGSFMLLPALLSFLLVTITPGRINHSLCFLFKIFSLLASIVVIFCFPIMVPAVSILFSVLILVTSTCLYSS